MPLLVNVGLIQYINSQQWLIVSQLKNHELRGFWQAPYIKTREAFQSMLSLLQIQASLILISYDQSFQLTILLQGQFNLSSEMCFPIILHYCGYFALQCDSGDMWTLFIICSRSAPAQRVMCYSFVVNRPRPYRILTRNLRDFATWRMYKTSQVPAVSLMKSVNRSHLPRE